MLLSGIGQFVIIRHAKIYVTECVLILKGHLSKYLAGNPPKLFWGKNLQIDHKLQ
jgi:hypothetical protein